MALREVTPGWPWLKITTPVDAHLQRQSADQEIDPYLWIPSGPMDQEVSLRYVLLEDADHERRPWVALFLQTDLVDYDGLWSISTRISWLIVVKFSPDRCESGSAKLLVNRGRAPSFTRLLAAFKRSPEWIGVTEQFYMTSRQDVSSLDVLALCTKSRATYRRGFARRMRREKPSLTPALGKVDFVIESLELQMRRDPVHSVSITCGLGILAEVLEVTRQFLNNFRIRAAFHHNPLAWDLEVPHEDMP
eukprot:Skav235621  [mRNA]  locus=scaffold358:213099:219199:+ [translate_table: standard]